MTQSAGLRSCNNNVYWIELWEKKVNSLVANKNHDKVSININICISSITKCNGHLPSKTYIIWFYSVKV